MRGFGLRLRFVRRLGWGFGWRFGRGRFGRGVDRLGRGDGMGGEGCADGLERRLEDGRRERRRFLGDFLGYITIIQPIHPPPPPPPSVFPFPFPFVNRCMIGDVLLASNKRADRREPRGALTEVVAPPGTGDEAEGAVQVFCARADLGARGEEVDLGFFGRGHDGRAVGRGCRRA